MIDADATSPAEHFLLLRFSIQFAASHIPPPPPTLTPRSISLFRQRRSPDMLRLLMPQLQFSLSSQDAARNPRTTAARRPFARRVVHVRARYQTASLAAQRADAARPRTISSTHTTRYPYTLSATILRYCFDPSALISIPWFSPAGLPPDSFSAPRCVAITLSHRWLTRSTVCLFDVFRYSSPDFR